jgi:ribosomal protein L20
MPGTNHRRLHMEGTEEQTQTSTGDTVQSGGDAKWYDSFPDDLKGNEAITGLDGPESLAKGFIEAQGKLAEYEASKPVIPGKPEEYDLPVKFEGLPEELTKEAAASIAKNALLAGLTKDQAGKLMAGLLADEKASLTQATADIKKAQEATITELKKEYGDKYQEKLDNGILRINQIAAKAGMEGDAFKAFINETGIGDNKTFIKFAIALADLISPDTFEQNQGGAEKSAAEVLYPTMNKT